MSPERNEEADVGHPRETFALFGHADTEPIAQRRVRERQDHDAPEIRPWRRIGGDPLVTDNIGIHAGARDGFPELIDD